MTANHPWPQLPTSPAPHPPVATLIAESLARYERAVGK